MSPASVGPITVVEVVTRYGHKHLAIQHRFDDEMSRYFTACMGTSSWTIESWRRNPDHPLGITAMQMEALPLCTECKAILRPEQEDGLTHLPVNTRHPGEYVLVDLRGHTWSWQDGTWKRANQVQRERAVRAIRGSDG